MQMDSKDLGKKAANHRLAAKAWLDMNRPGLLLDVGESWLFEHSAISDNDLKTILIVSLEGDEECQRRALRFWRMCIAKGHTPCVGNCYSAVLLASRLSDMDTCLEVVNILRGLDCRFDERVTGMLKQVVSIAVDDRDVQAREFIQSMPPSRQT